MRKLRGEGDLWYSRLTRIRIPVAVPEADVTMEILCPPELHGHVIADVTINPRRIGRPYRYLYGMCIVGPRPCNSFNGVCRVDVVQKSLVTWSDSPNVIISGAPVFVPRPNSAPPDSDSREVETEGVLIVDGLGADGCSLFVVLSARSFAEVARVAVPYRHTMSPGTTFAWDREA